MGPSDFITTENAAASALIQSRNALTNAVQNLQQTATALGNFLNANVPGLSGTTYTAAIAGIKAWAAANPNNPNVAATLQTLADLQGQLAAQQGYVTALAAAVAAVAVPAGM